MIKMHACIEVSWSKESRTGKLNFHFGFLYFLLWILWLGLRYFKTLRSHSLSTTLASSKPILNFIGSSFYIISYLIASYITFFIGRSMQSWSLISFFNGTHTCPYLTANRYPVWWLAVQLSAGIYLPLISSAFLSAPELGTSSLAFVWLTFFAYCILEFFYLIVKFKCWSRLCMKKWVTRFHNWILNGGS